MLSRCASSSDSRPRFERPSPRGSHSRRSPSPTRPPPRRRCHRTGQPAQRRQTAHQGSASTACAATPRAPEHARRVTCPDSSAPARPSSAPPTAHAPPATRARATIARRPRATARRRARARGSRVGARHDAGRTRAAPTWRRRRRPATGAAPASRRGPCRARRLRAVAPRARRAACGPATARPATPATPRRGAASSARRRATRTAPRSFAPTERRPTVLRFDARGTSASRSAPTTRAARPGTHATLRRGRASHPERLLDRSTADAPSRPRCLPTAPIDARGSRRRQRSSRSAQSSRGDDVRRRVERSPAGPCYGANRYVMNRADCAMTWSSRRPRNAAWCSVTSRMLQYTNKISRGLRRAESTR